GALVTGSAWQTPPGARPNRGLAPALFGAKAGEFRPERPGLVAGAAGQPVAEMNGCLRAAGPSGYRARNRTRLTGPLAFARSGHDRGGRGHAGFTFHRLEIAALRPLEHYRGQP